MSNSVARMGISLGFAAVGSYFGPTGFAIGGMIGGMVGGLLFPDHAPPTHTSGPRLSEMAVQTSTYGSAIPLIYGTVRVAGNVIWSGPFLEHTHIEYTHQSGKGGSPQPSSETTYIYTMSLAIALCNNEIAGIKRVWADDKLWYDFSNPPIGTSFEHELYTGTETQLPSPTIEADKGVGNVSAFRGIAYIVFRDLDLGAFGNRVPNFHFEVVEAGERALNASRWLSPLLGDGGGLEANLEIDPETGYVWVTHSFNDAVYVITPDLETKFEILDKISAPYRLSYQPRFMYIDQPGQFEVGVEPKLREMEPRMFVGCDSWGSLNIGNASWAAIDTRDQEVYTKYDLNGNPLSFQPWGGIPLVDMRFIKPDEVNMEDRARVHLMGANVNAHSYTWIIGRHPVPFYFPYYLFDMDFSQLPPPVGYFIQWCDASDPDMPFAYVLDSDAVIHAMEEVFYPHNSVRDPNVFAFANSKDQLRWDKFERYLYAITTDWPSGTTWLTKWSYDLKVRVWGRSKINIEAWQTLDIHPNTGALYVLSKDFAGSYWLHEIDKATGESLSEWPVVSGMENTAYPKMRIYPNSMFAMVACDGPGGSVSVARLPLTPAPTGTPVSLESVVQDLSVRTGLELSDLDTSDLATDVVMGYVLATPMQARNAIEPLMRGYFFDVVESDHLAKFIKRGGASIRTIDTDEAAAHQEESKVPAPRERTRIEENEMPWQVDVNYMDVASNYKVSVQYARRLIGYSKNTITANIAAVFTSTQVKRIAEVLLYNAWAERQTAKLHLTRKYADLDPSDLITFDDNGSQQLYRVVRSDYSYPNHVELEVTEDDVSVYSQVGLGVDATIPSEVIPALVPTLLYLLDISIMGRETDDDVGFYYAGTPSYGDSWPGAALMQSSDGFTYAAVGEIKNAVTAGYATSTLGYEGSPT